MAVTARFKVTRITKFGDAEDAPAEVEMTPDYAQGRNAEWAAATPSGVCRLTISNPPALAQFEQGQPVAITFEPGEE